ncbi:MAG: DUF2000 domain-containing protein [Candidatus Micrarchaeota archaeon]|nr:DUF2000 domain-containing protein [Candidatus Micrarchaeota archaeon]
MKIAIVLNETLGSGYLVNAAACIASGLFNGEQNILGPQIEGNDFTYIPITKIPILVLKQNKKPWKELLERAKKNKLKYMVFTREGQSTTSYEEYIKNVVGKPIEQVDVIGMGVLGDDNYVTKFSGDLGLLR